MDSNDISILLNLQYFILILIIERLFLLFYNNAVNIVKSKFYNQLFTDVSLAMNNNALLFYSCSFMNLTTGNFIEYIFIK